LRGLCVCVCVLLCVCDSIEIIIFRPLSHHIITKHKHTHTHIHTHTHTHTYLAHIKGTKGLGGKDRDDGVLERIGQGELACVCVCVCVCECVYVK
jgi:hypothetical protein